MIRHPCILGDPQTKGTKSELAASPLPSRWPERGQKCYITPAFSNPQGKGDEIRSGCLTSAFSGALQRAEMLCHPCILGDPQSKGEKIISGCLIPAFSVA